MKLFTAPAKTALAVAAFAAATAIPGQAQAMLVNLDISRSATLDAYSTGAGVFGTASSVWNEVLASSPSVSKLALKNDAGAASGVSVTYLRNSSGLASTTGAFAALGGGNVATGAVRLDGLVAGAQYDLAVFSAWDGTPSFQVGADVESLAPNFAWSTLTQGVQYVLFHAVANSNGSLSFTPLANPGGSGGASRWTAFQLQSADIPEPVTPALVLAGLGLMAVFRRRR